MDQLAAQKAAFLGPGDGATVWVFGVMITIRLFGNQTGGHFAVHEDIIMPGRGPPPHYHTREDEYWYVAEGRVKMTRGDEVFYAETGSLIQLPKHVPHSFVNDRDTPARLIITYAPAGFEAWFHKTGEATKPGDTPYDSHPPPSPESLGRAVRIAADDFGMHFLPPPDAGAGDQTDEL